MRNSGRERRLLSGQRCRVLGKSLIIAAPLVSIFAVASMKTHVELPRDYSREAIEKQVAEIAVAQTGRIGQSLTEGESKFTISGKIDFDRYRSDVVRLDREMRDERRNRVSNTGLAGFVTLGMSAAGLFLLRRSPKF
jgi:hypothetical protein